MQAFHDFYQSLYTTTLPSGLDPEVLASFLDQIALGWLSDAERAQLVNPITTEEVLAVIKSLSTDKAPGLDGLPADLYSTC